MSAEEILRSNEEQAENNITLTDEQATNGGIVFTGAGKNKAKNSSKFGKKAKRISAAVFVIIILFVVMILFTAGNILPAALSNRLQEETDVQYADAVMSKEIIFQQALREGDIPDNTAEILEDNNVIVGYIGINGDFVKTNQYDGELSLKMNDRVISADDFIENINSNVDLYSAFNDATYSRAAYWYDDSANEVMKAFGTNRNNYTGDSFETVMTRKMGSGSKININNATQSEECSTDGGSGTDCLIVNGDSSVLKIDSADTLISEISIQNKATNSTDATLNAADEMKVADTITNEQRSGLFYLLLMENVSKMQAGYGNESQINEMMDYLYMETTNEVVDVKTGETVTVTGTALESPSLYAILTGDDVNMREIQNYSNDRILHTIENKVSSKNNTIGETVASTDDGATGTIGRIFGINETTSADKDTLDIVNKTVDNALVKNSFADINGVRAGEMLAEGAVNVGKELAKYSGATAGDAQAVEKYAKIHSDILAMDAAVDRQKRSPFDITSKNTFLGSIVYNFAVGLSFNTGNNSLLSNVTDLTRVARSATTSVFTSVYADNINGYLTNHGDCETIGLIGAVGSPQCTMVATFDTSTLNDPLNNPQYLEFVKNNTDGESVIKDDTKLAGFIKNHIGRKTPVGITDGGILSESSKSSSEEGVPFLSDLYGLFGNLKDSIKGLLNRDKTEKERAATGELFVNSSNNPDWETYKWAQRYVSLARAQESLRKYAVNYDGRVAYDIKTLEGGQNPVIAYIYDYLNMDTEIAENESY